MQPLRKGLGHGQHPFQLHSRHHPRGVTRSSVGRDHRGHESRQENRSQDFGFSPPVLICDESIMDSRIRVAICASAFGGAVDHYVGGTDFFEPSKCEPHPLSNVAATNQVERFPALRRRGVDLRTAPRSPQPTSPSNAKALSCNPILPSSATITRISRAIDADDVPSASPNLAPRPASVSSRTADDRCRPISPTPRCVN